MNNVAKKTLWVFGLAGYLLVLGCTSIEYYAPASQKYNVIERSSCFGGRDVPDILAFNVMSIEGELSVELLENVPGSTNKLIIRLILKVPSGSVVNFDSVRVLIGVDESQSFMLETIEYFERWDFSRETIPLLKVKNELLGGHNESRDLFGKTVEIPYRYYSTLPILILGPKPRKISIQVNGLNFNGIKFELPMTEFYLKKANRTYHLNC